MAHTIPTTLLKIKSSNSVEYHAWNKSKMPNSSQRSDTLIWFHF